MHARVRARAFGAELMKSVHKIKLLRSKFILNLSKMKKPRKLLNKVAIAGQIG